MTNAFLFRRRVLPSWACDWCHDGHQTDLYILRDCPNERRVWRILVPNDYWEFFCRPVNIVQWFRANWDLDRRRDPLLCNWRDIFRQTVHELWYSHNHRKHRNFSRLNPLALTEKSLQYVVELLSVGAGVNSSAWFVIFPCTFCLILVFINTNASGFRQKKKKLNIFINLFNRHLYKRLHFKIIILVENVCCSTKTLCRSISNSIRFTLQIR